MAASKKYESRVIASVASEGVAQQGVTKEWSAEIIRRATATKTVVSKAQGGFTTEAEAQTWAERELAVFLELNERNKIKSRNKKRD
ncbi:MAG: DUF3622 domain-containing protein [Gammaproteobacteria bacterium]|nr:DUF3622 domain-containing protein [Gammaproteobacteria bacterium]